MATRRVVYKYPLPVDPNKNDLVQIHVQGHFIKAVMVALIEDKPFVWIEFTHNSNTSPQIFEVKCVGTGETIRDDRATHWGSYQQGEYIWHVYAINQRTQPVESSYERTQRLSTKPTDPDKDKAMQDALLPVYSTADDVRNALIEVVREANRQGWVVMETQISLISINRRGTGGKPPRSIPLD